MVTALLTENNSVYLFDDKEKVVTGGILGNEYHRYSYSMFTDVGACALFIMEGDEEDLTTSRIQAKWEGKSPRRQRTLSELLA